MKQTATAADWYASQPDWHAEVGALRDIVLAAGLAETIKWRQPCYTLDGKNIAIVSRLKLGAILSFLKGGLVEDPNGRLVSPGPNARQGKYAIFTSVAQILAERELIDALLASAIEVERSGRRFPDPPDADRYCDELQWRIDGDAEFREAFSGLTPGRRRHYNMHFAQAKRPATREARIEKSLDRILMGKGLRDCICGRSKRMPQCDGSHRDGG